MQKEKTPKKVPKPLALQPLDSADSAGAKAPHGTGPNASRASFARPTDLSSGFDSPVKADRGGAFSQKQTKRRVTMKKSKNLYLLGISKKIIRF